jgi:hypothetical protein
MLNRTPFSDIIVPAPGGLEMTEQAVETMAGRIALK